MSHRIESAAEADLDQIWLYVARESGSMDIATRFVESITDRFIFLANFPYAGRSRDRDFGFGFRSFAVGEYLIVYQVEGTEIAVLRVVHGRRDLDGLFTGEE